MPKFLLLLIPIFLFSCSRPNEYSDWFELNVKGEPSYIKEVSSYSLAGFTNPEHLKYLDYDLGELLMIKEYFFDSAGMIKEETIESSIFYYDSIRKPLGKNKEFAYRDSVISITYYPDNKIHQKEIKYFDKYGFLDSIKYIGFLNGYVNYIRDKNLRIIEEVRDLSGIGPRMKIKTIFKRNELGDILIQKKYTELTHSGGYIEKLEPQTEKFEYIYDDEKNWVVRGTFINDTLVKITQREIKD